MQSNFLTPEFTAGGDEAVEGIYPLGALLGRSSLGIVYETRFSESPAAIKVALANLPDSEEVLERWKAAMALSHPNLLRVYAAGTSMLNDSPIIYVVMERGEESLASVLAGRRLSEEEVREMLNPALSALFYLHRNDFAHGRIKPSNILAVGEMVKLSSDSVSAASEAAVAEDARAIGYLIQQSIAPDPGLAASAVLGDIVDHALETDPARRWTVARMQARLRAPEPAEEALKERHGGFPKWIVAGLAALVLIVVGLAVIPKKEPPPAPVGAPVTQAPPAVAARPAIPAPATPAVSQAHGRRATGWAVIVSAYGTRAPAEKRERSLASKWPGFQWSVLQQRAEKSYYLVVIGRDLSEDEADALRKRAINGGLPRDTYIKRM